MCIAFKLLLQIHLIFREISEQTNGGAEAENKNGDDPDRVEIRMLRDIDIELGPDSPLLETFESLLEECLGASFKSLTAVDSNGRTLLHRFVNRIKDDIQVRFAFDQSKSLIFFFKARRSQAGRAELLRTDINGYF